jgi:hypothetical protein
VSDDPDDDLDDDWNGHPPPDTRARALREGLRLGLPREWLGRLPEVELLPGRYSTSDPNYGRDTFLTWKAQEHLVRTGRLAEVDPDLVAEALEDAAANDGPKWLDRWLRRAMFLLAWPKHSYHLGVELGMAIDMLEGCFEASPSMWLTVEPDWQDTWQLARFEILGLDEALEPELPEACPWPTLPALLAAARTQAREEERHNWLGERP